MTEYARKTSADTESTKCLPLGKLDQKRDATTASDRWSFLTSSTTAAAKTVEELAQKDPVYVDVIFPTIDETYRYLKIIVHDTFKRMNSEVNSNQQKYFTLHELEVYVKKN